MDRFVNWSNSCCWRRTLETTNSVVVVVAGRLGACFVGVIHVEINAD